MINQIEWARNLIKGRIAEAVFEQMMRDEDQYVVIPFGYEHTMPTLAQYRQHFSEVQKIIDNIADAPDFALISKDNTKIYLVEVKYQATFDFKKVKEHAEKLCKRWEFPWLLIATPKRFYCGMARNILAEDKIDELSDSWVNESRRAEYLKLLNEFEK